MQVDLGEVSYRKFQMYDINWKEKGIQIENFQVFGSQLGGPIALVKEEKRIASDDNSEIHIFTSAGNNISTIDWNSQSKIVGVGWNDCENLLVVLEDGICRMFSIHGHLTRCFQLLEGAINNAKLLECLFWGNGVVGISSDMQLHAAEGVASIDGSIRKFRIKTGLAPERPYTSMALIPPRFSRSNIVEVILGTTNSSVVVAHEHGYEDQLLQDRVGAPICKMAVAPNGQFLACYRRDGILTVLSSAFTTKVLDFDTGSLSRPLDIAWCGDDAVVLLWKNTGVVMVGPYGDWINFPYGSSAHLIAEPDCCRIITDSGCELLQRLPLPIEAVRKIGSTDPAALMYDAMEAYEEGDPKSDENIRSIGVSQQLDAAVQTCIAAATAEFDIPKQQAFLKAASYGKAFCNESDPSLFVKSALKIRVLNEIRKPSVGLPLTSVQYDRLTAEVLIRRLIVRNYHLLAIKICELLRIRKENVLAHWAAEKVRRLSVVQPPVSDEDICAVIRRKLESHDTRISYQEVAGAAHESGRKKLAKLILGLEQDPTDQIPLLLEMKEEDTALQKAVATHDTELVYLVLLNLEHSRHLEKQAFYRMIQPYPEALSLLKTYYQTRVTSTDKTALSNFLVFNKNYTDAGIAAVNQAYLQPTMDLKVQCLKEASQLFSLGRGDSASLKAMTDEQLELIDMQNTLEIRSKKDFVGLSLSETLYNVTMLGLENPTDANWDREIAKIMRQFRVSEKTLWHIKIQCCCRSGSWAALNKLANEKKSPIGYKPFALACIKCQQPVTETERYVDKVSEPEERCDLYIELKLWRKAFDTAAKLKDTNRLLEVGRLCQDPQLERAAQELLSRI